jgi:hypothetical protein
VRALVDDDDDDDDDDEGEEQVGDGSNDDADDSEAAAGGVRSRAWAAHDCSGYESSVPTPAPVRNRGSRSRSSRRSAASRFLDLDADESEDDDDGGGGGGGGRGHAGGEYEDEDEDDAGSLADFLNDTEESSRSQTQTQTQGSAAAGASPSRPRKPHHRSERDRGGRRGAALFHAMEMEASQDAHARFRRGDTGGGSHMDRVLAAAYRAVQHEEYLEACGLDSDEDGETQDANGLTLDDDEISHYSDTHDL